MDVYGKTITGLGPIDHHKGSETRLLMITVVMVNTADTVAALLPRGLHPFILS